MQELEIRSRSTEAREKHILNTPETFTDNDGFIVRKKITAILKKEMKDYIHSTDREARLMKFPQITFSQHGADITADIVDPVSRVMASNDFVLALPCPSWPTEAEGWLYRTRVAFKKADKVYCQTRVSYCTKSTPC